MSLAARLPEGQFTQHGRAHTRLLTPGFMVLVIENDYTIPRGSKLLAWFFWLSNARRRAAREAD